MRIIMAIELRCINAPKQYYDGQEPTHTDDWLLPWRPSTHRASDSVVRISQLSINGLTVEICFSRFSDSYENLWVMIYGTVSMSSNYGSYDSYVTDTDGSGRTFKCEGDVTITQPSQSSPNGNISINLRVYKEYEFNGSKVTLSGDYTHNTFNYDGDIFRIWTNWEA
jgi:hypothetical protein